MDPPFFKKHGVTCLRCLIYLESGRMIWCKVLQVPGGLLEAIENHILRWFCNGKFPMIIWLYFFFKKVESPISIWKLETWDHRNLHWIIIFWKFLAESWSSSSSLDFSLACSSSSTFIRHNCTLLPVRHLCVFGAASPALFLFGIL